MRCRRLNECRAADIAERKDRTNCEFLVSGHCGGPVQRFHLLHLRDRPVKVAWRSSGEPCYSASAV